MGPPPEISEKKIENGQLGNLQTVEEMRQIASARAGNPLVRSLALEIVHSAAVPSGHYLDESRAIGQYVHEFVRYVRDPVGFEQLTDPVLMIKNIMRGKAQGDCDDMALLLASLLKAIGHRPRFRMVRYKGFSGPYQHIYVVDYDTNGPKSTKKRIVLDAIVKTKPIGFEVPHVSGDEVLV